MKKTTLLIFFTLLFIIVVLFLSQINYVENEGFNPSDDGVIIAQSFRLLNGEIAHKDFISIRPIFSGIIHTIHFSGILPIQISARWFVVFQFFVYSFIWVYILFVSVFKSQNCNTSKYINFFSFSLFVFFLNMGNYNLFPWTTIDALFLSSIGFLFYRHLFTPNLRNYKLTINLSLGLLFFSLAALCRQNFVFVALLLFLFEIVYLFKNRKIKIVIISSFVGASPFLFYAVYLFYNNSFSLFIEQMTGRTELFETGIKQFISSFIHAKLFALNIFIILYILFTFYEAKFRNINSNINHTEKHKLTAIISVIIYFVLAILFSFYHFTTSAIDVLTVPFELFWISVIVFIFRLVYNKNLSKEAMFLYATIIFIAWSSSISLGDNSPVFYIGSIFALITTISISIVYAYCSEKLDKLQKLSTYIIIPLLFVFIFLAINSQNRLNYRDLSSDKLNSSMSIFKEFGNIKTNQNTYEYHKNLLQLYNTLPNCKDNFVVIPNAASIYPILKSKNPFPLDWLQPAEFIGQEEYLLTEIENVLQTRNIYIFIDKFNSKKMYNKLEIMDYSDNPVIPLIKKYATEVAGIENKFFRIYRTNCHASASL